VDGKKDSLRRVSARMKGKASDEEGKKKGARRKLNKGAQEKEKEQRKKQTEDNLRRRGGEKGKSRSGSLGREERTKPWSATRRGEAVT